MSPPQREPFSELVFGGGGARCFWEAGVAQLLHERGAINIERASAVSGGAVVAASLLGRCLDTLLDNMRKQFARLDHNVRWKAIGSNKALLPHCTAYHQAISDTFGKEAMRQIAEGPELLVSLTRPPARWPHKLAVAVASSVHESERLIRQTPHGRWCRQLGFRQEVVRANDLETGDQLASLLIASGCVPPFIPLQTWDDRPSLDGSLLDNAPAAVLEEKRQGDAGRPILILVTRRYGRLPERGNRTYLSPSRDLPAHKLDFTDADSVDRAYRLGREDAETFLSDCVR